LPHASPSPLPASRRLIVLAAAVAFLISLCAFASLGSQDSGLAILTVFDRLIVAGAAPAAYLLAGVGLGRLFRPIFRGGSDPLALQATIGLAALLWLSHLLGWLGLLSNAAVAIAPIAVGCILAAHQLFSSLKGRGIEVSLSPLSPLTAIGLALLLAAACNPPGALWSSEFGAYDVLEYHLQLPQEWLAGGRIEPLRHNVYSFLPGYLEAAYTHLGAMTLAPRHAPDGAAAGLAAGEGYRLISCQLLHAGFAIIAAWLTSRFVQIPLRACGGGGPGSARPGVAEHHASLAPSLAFALLLLTPWTIVTGSMAYNEMALLAFFAAALLAASDPQLSSARRSVLCGLLIGAASSVKPTALLFCGLPAAVFLLFHVITPSPQHLTKRLAALTVPGTLAGLAVLAPWLIRNYAAAHNPVFPFAADLLGHGHWTAEQAVRYAGAHQFHGSLLDRLRLIILPDPHPTQANVSPHRGLMHPQFGVLFPLALLSLPLGWRTVEEWPTTRRLNALLVLSLLIQLILWLTTTHLQSRFLIPLTVPAVVLCATSIAATLCRFTAKGRGDVRALSPLLLMLLALPPAAQLAYSTWIFSRERNGEPNELLISGPALRTGQVFREMSEADQRSLLESANCELFITAALSPDATVCLLGDATPLYLTRRVIYNTTYDPWPVSGDPAAWSGQLREKHADFVLVNLGEISRLQRSRWLPPDVTVDAVKDWLIHHATVVRAWDRDGVYLVRPTDQPQPINPFVPAWQDSRPTPAPHP
jgi:hypothetical protein